MMFEAAAYGGEITKDFTIDWKVDSEGIMVITIQSDASIVPEWSFALDIQTDEEVKIFLAELSRFYRTLATYVRGDRGGPTPETQRHWNEKQPSA